MPQHEEDPITQAEQQVEDALDGLVATGALQKENCMDIEHLLNPANESVLLDEGSDQETLQWVMDAVAVRENLEIVGGEMMALVNLLQLISKFFKPPRSSMYTSILWMIPSLSSGRLSWPPSTAICVLMRLSLPGLLRFPIGSGGMRIKQVKESTKRPLGP